MKKMKNKYTENNSFSTTNNSTSPSSSSCLSVYTYGCSSDDDCCGNGVLECDSGTCQPKDGTNLITHYWDGCMP